MVCVIYSDLWIFTRYVWYFEASHDFPGYARYVQTSSDFTWHMRDGETFEKPSVKVFSACVVGATSMSRLH